MTSTVQQLTIEETDVIVLKACTTQDGAIDDCETSETEIHYFFESGATGIVNRTTGRVITEQPPV